MAIYVKIYLIFIFSLFVWLSITIWWYT